MMHIGMLAGAAFQLAEAALTLFRARCASPTPSRADLRLAELASQRSFVG
jgi:hypothetical protein